MQDEINRGYAARRLHQVAFLTLVLGVAGMLFCGLYVATLNKLHKLEASSKQDLLDYGVAKIGWTICTVNAAQINDMLLKDDEYSQDEIEWYHEHALYFPTAEETKLAQDVYAVWKGLQSQSDTAYAAIRQNIDDNAEASRK